MIRRHLRRWAAASLVLQSAWLFALAPRECCASHAAPTAAPCHEEARATHCPMKDGAGAACPMHRGGHDHAAPAGDCTMRGACSGPMSSLLTLLSAQAVLTPPQHLSPLLLAAPHPGAIDEQRISRFAPPESPPPRA